MFTEEITIFQVVAEEGSFSKAATKLDITHAAVLKRVNRLEQKLGVRLLNRSNKGVSLTEAGKVFSEDVEDLLQRTDIAIEKVRNIDDVRR